MKTTKKLRKSFLIIITSILFSGFFVSCDIWSRGFAPKMTRDDIRQIQQFEPLAYVGSIEKGNGFIYSDSLTKVAKTLFEEELSRSKTLPVKGNIVIEDSLLNLRVQSEIYVLMSYVENNYRFDKVVIPPTIDSILEARNERFGLLAYNWGFTQTSGNYDNGAQVVIQTLGTVYTVPCLNMTRSDIVIVDSENNNLAYVGKAHNTSDPIKAETYRKQVDRLLKNYRK